MPVSAHNPFFDRGAVLRNAQHQLEEECDEQQRARAEEFWPYGLEALDNEHLAIAANLIERTVSCNQSKAEGRSNDR
ncbi:MAG: hypothetical protein R3C70_07095 [Geminicoccaceae bacterium]